MRHEGTNSDGSLSDVIASPRFDLFIAVLGSEGKTGVAVVVAYIVETELLGARKKLLLLYVHVCQEVRLQNRIRHRHAALMARTMVRTRGRP